MLIIYTYNGGLIDILKEQSIDDLTSYRLEYCNKRSCDYSLRL